MNQNKIPTNKQIVEALKQVLPLLNNGTHQERKTTYICFAVKDTKAPHFVKQYITNKIITPRLEGNPTLGTWLMSKGVFLGKYLTAKRLVQLHRKAWVRKLIEEFSDEH